eukprot:SAG31_NODE_444_length_15625_cov_6.047469_14_plen_110_part_00
MYRADPPFYPPPQKKNKNKNKPNILNLSHHRGLTVLCVERGRDPLMPLDRDKVILDHVPEREDTREFAAIMWNIEKQVNERPAKASPNFTCTRRHAYDRTTCTFSVSKL